MGLLAFPFMACFVLAIFGWPFALMFYFYCKNKQKERLRKIQAQAKAGAFVSRTYTDRLNRGNRMTDKEFEQLKERASKRFGVTL